MEGINDQLNNKIKKECIDKQAREAAKDIVEHRRPITRSRIEDLEAMAALEKEWILD